METGQVDICFPVVGGGVCEMVKVICFPLKIGDTASIAILLEGAEGRGNDIINLLTGIRSAELEKLQGLMAAPVGSIALPVCLPVCIAFKPSKAFCGNSFSLAVAIADKRARYGAGLGRNGAILATGIIQPDSHGLVDRVEGFDAKLTAMAAKARPGDTIIVPAANLTANDGTAERLWRALSESEVNCHTIEQIDDVDFLWGPERGVREALLNRIITALLKVLEDSLTGIKTSLLSLSLSPVHAIGSLFKQESRRVWNCAVCTVNNFVRRVFGVSRVFLGSAMLILFLGGAAVLFMDDNSKTSERGSLERTNVENRAETDPKSLNPIERVPDTVIKEITEWLKNQ